MATRLFSMRISLEEQKTLQVLALNFGYTYGGEPSIAAMIRAIAQGEIILIPKKSDKKT